MKPAPFEYARPESVAEAVALLAERPSEAKILAGGQSLVPMMNFRMARPDLLIDINRLSELDYHRIEGGELVIGALVRHATLRASELVRDACPLMAEAYQDVAHGPIRNRGTLCGNLCHADPASEMPAVMLATEATLVLRSSRGERRLPAEAFFLGTYETAVEEDELLIEIRIPVAPDGQGWSFEEISVRKGDFAMVGVATTLAISGGGVIGASISLCGVGDRAQRLRSVEASLIGAVPEEDIFTQAAAAAAAAVDPQSDIHADADYRRDLVRALVGRTLSVAAKRAV
jgi:carbon-monoxide dehydrogenase medium subunit